LGDDCLAGGELGLLEVPSAILANTSNVLLNPLHPDAGRIRVVWQQPYPFDRRFLKVHK